MAWTRDGQKIGIVYEDGVVIVGKYAILKYYIFI
jgi:hypothetical protein